jgi:hypothetical protein
MGPYTQSMTWRFTRNELQKVWKRAYYCSGHSPGETGEIHEETRDSRCPGRESNPVPFKYKSTLRHIHQSLQEQNGYLFPRQQIVFYLNPRKKRGGDFSLAASRSQGPSLLTFPLTPSITINSWKMAAPIVTVQTGHNRTPFPYPAHGFGWPSSLKSAYIIVIHTSFLKIEAEYSSEVSVSTYKTALCYDQEEENQKPSTLFDRLMTSQIGIRSSSLTGQHMELTSLRIQWRPCYYYYY